MHADLTECAAHSIDQAHYLKVRQTAVLVLPPRTFSLPASISVGAFLRKIFEEENNTAQESCNPVGILL